MRKADDVETLAWHGHEVTVETWFEQCDHPWDGDGPAPDCEGVDLLVEVTLCPESHNFKAYASLGSVYGDHAYVEAEVATLVQEALSGLQTELEAVAAGRDVLTAHARQALALRLLERSPVESYEVFAEGRAHTFTDAREALIFFDAMRVKHGRQLVSITLDGRNAESRVRALADGHTAAEIDASRERFEQLTRKGVPETRALRIAKLQAIVGYDPDLGVVVDHADPNATAEELADIVREARADAAVEREGERGLV